MIKGFAQYITATDEGGNMRVLVGCEFSGTVRDAFIAQGHDAWSCDILRTESEGPHYQGSVLDILSQNWDLAIFHPPCTYLTNSGVRWLYHADGSRNEARWQMMADAARFFQALLNAPIPRIAIENPIMHRHARALIDTPYAQVIQPWMFGHGETKATCLWLKNLPPLKPTNIVAGRESRIHRLPPSPDRWKERSKTYQGIADAMVEQWGGPAESRLFHQIAMFV